MNSLNRVTLIGNIGKDQRIEKGENAQAQFSLETYTPWKDKNGEYIQSNEWHTIRVVNEVLLETLVPKLKKGDLVFVDGVLKTRKWVDEMDNLHHISEVIIEKGTGKIVILRPSLEVPYETPEVE